MRHKLARSKKFHFESHNITVVPQYSQGIGSRDPYSCQNLRMLKTLIRNGLITVKLLLWCVLWGLLTVDLLKIMLILIDNACTYHITIKCLKAFIWKPNVSLFSVLNNTVHISIGIF